MSPGDCFSNTGTALICFHNLPGLSAGARRSAGVKARLRLRRAGRRPVKAAIFEFSPRLSGSNDRVEVSTRLPARGISKRCNIAAFPRCINELDLTSKEKQVTGVQHLEVGPDQTGQRLDNFLMSALKGVPPCGGVPHDPHRSGAGQWWSLQTSAAAGTGGSGTGAASAHPQ